MFEFLLGLSIALQPTIDNPTTTTIPTEQIEVQIHEPILTSSNTPILNAHSTLAIDLNTNTILYHNKENQPSQIASLTKIMTALIILEENDLNEVVTIPYEATQIGGSSMHLKAQEKITVKELLHGLLIQSGNDAAISLAVHNSGSVENFVNKMNAKVNQFGLTQTHFQNPMGFDHTNNYSTATDLAQLTIRLYQKPIIKEIVAKAEYTAKSNDSLYSHNLKSSNKLLNTYTQIIGLKTGTTDQAQECFIGITNTTNPTLTIILGSNNRFNDTEVLLDWIKNSYNYN